MNVKTLIVSTIGLLVAFLAIPALACSGNACTNAATVTGGFTGKMDSFGSSGFKFSSQDMPKNSTYKATQIHEADSGTNLHGTMKLDTCQSGDCSSRVTVTGAAYDMQRAAGKAEINVPKSGVPQGYMTQMGSGASSSVEGSGKAWFK